MHDVTFRLRMTRDERAMLEALAERSGLTASDIVRQLVRREHAAAFAEAPQRQRKPKQRKL